MKRIKAKYIGKEFPTFYGKEIEVENDVENLCYKIKFEGENYWHDNMDDEDIEFPKEEFWECTF